MFARHYSIHSIVIVRMGSETAPESMNLLSVRILVCEMRYQTDAENANTIRSWPEGDEM